MNAQLGARRRGQGGSLLLTFSLLLLMAASALMVYELVTFRQRQDLLPSGLTVAGVDVSGFSGRDAVARWESAYAEPLLLLYRDANGIHPIRFHPDQAGWQVSSEPMLADAQASGERDGGFWRRFLDHLLGAQQGGSHEIPLVASYQENALQAVLQDIASRYDDPPGGPGFDIQTLTVFPGESGFALDIEAAKAAIDSAMHSPLGRVVELPIRSVAQEMPALDTLRDLIIEYLDSEGFIHDGQRTLASVFVLDLITGEELNILGDVAYSAASTIKLPIMIELFRRLDAPPSQDEAWLLANSLLCSNNSSSNLLMQIIGAGDIFAGLNSVSATLQRIGGRNSYISAPFITGVAGQVTGSIQPPATNPNPRFVSAADPYNQTTAEDMGTLFSMLYDCAEFASGLVASLPQGEISQNECRQMLQLMSANDIERLLQGGIPRAATISHKNGWVFDTVGDAGVVYSPNGRDYAIAVFLWEETEFQDYEKLWPLVEAISRAAWNYFNPEEAILLPRADLPATAVECEGNYLPPSAEYVDLDNINGWRSR